MLNLETRVSLSPEALVSLNPEARVSRNAEARVSLTPETRVSQPRMGRGFGRAPRGSGGSGTSAEDGSGVQA